MPQFSSPLSRPTRRSGRPRRAYIIALAGIILIGFSLRLAPISRNRFHEDEALYAYWGLQIATGADPMLNRAPVDKPPLFLYLEALSFTIFGRSEVAARIPSLLASSAGIWLVGRLAERVYSRQTALVSALALALNPFDIAFAPTAFTDPLLVALVMGALLAASGRRWARAGVLAGLAFATKQQGVLFLPLIIGAGWLASPNAGDDHMMSISPPERSLARLRRAISAGWVRGAAGFIGPAAGALIWDAFRVQRPGYLAQSIMSYGGLELAPWGELGRRGAEWTDLIGLLIGSPLLGVLLALGLIVLLAGGRADGWRAGALDQAARFDRLFIAFIGGYLIVHWVFTFNIWDRYLLGLAPLIALLLGRILLLPGRWLGRVGRTATFTALVGMLVVCAALGWPAARAAGGGYPAGGDHGAYEGIDILRIVMEEQIPPQSIVYQRWLGWHFSYYMYGMPHDFRWYRTDDELARQASEKGYAPQWVVFPEWRGRAGAEQALARVNLQLQEAFRIRRSDGSISFRVFAITPAGSRGE